MRADPDLPVGGRTQGIPRSRRGDGYRARGVAVWNVSAVVWFSRYSDNIEGLRLECHGANFTTSIREFTTRSFPIYMFDGEGTYKVKTIGEVSS